MGQQQSSVQAIKTVTELCEKEVKGEWDLEVIDLIEHPQLAEDEKIIAIPTLIKKSPPPVRRLIGDLSDKEQVLIGLDIVIDDL